MLEYTYRKIYTKIIQPLFSLKGSPHSIALGATIGVWIAFTPTVGIQMTLALILCTIFRANVPIALAACWISNPVTFVPMYYGYYLFGLLVLDADATPWEEFRKQIINDYCIVATNLTDKHQAAGIPIFKLGPEWQNFLSSKDKPLSLQGKHQDIRQEFATRGIELPRDLSLKESIVNREWEVRNSQEKVFFFISKQGSNYVVYLSLLHSPEKIFRQIAQSGESFYYTAQDDKSTEYLLALKQKIPSFALQKVTGGFSKVAEKTKSMGGYAIVDYVTYLAEGQRHSLLPHKWLLVSEMDREYDFWSSAKRIVGISFQEFGVPLWVGSLIIATIIAIPCYPLSKTAVIRVRHSHLGQSAKEFTKKHLSSALHKSSPSQSSSKQQDESS